MAKQKKNIKIAVKQKHIKNGVKGDEGFCAIALAVKEQFKNAVDVEVDGMDITFFVPPTEEERKEAEEDGFELSAYDNPVHYNLPKRAQDFIEKFDNGEKVKPFEFTAKLDA